MNRPINIINPQLLLGGLYHSVLYPSDYKNRLIFITAVATSTSTHTGNPSPNAIFSDCQQALTSVLYLSRTVMLYSLSCQHLVKWITHIMQDSIRRNKFTLWAACDVFPDGVHACKHKQSIQWGCLWVCPAFRLSDDFPSCTTLNVSTAINSLKILQTSLISVTIPVVLQ